MVPEQADWLLLRVEGWEYGRGTVCGLRRQEGWWEKERLSDAAQCLKAPLSFFLLPSFWVPLQLNLYQTLAPHVVETPTLKHPTLNCQFTVFIPFFLLQGTRVIAFLITLVTETRKRKILICAQYLIFTDWKPSGKYVPSPTKKKWSYCLVVIHTQTHTKTQRLTCVSAWVWTGHDAFWLSINGSHRTGKNWRLHINIKISLCGLSWDLSLLLSMKQLFQQNIEFYLQFFMSW